MNENKNDMYSDVEFNEKIEGLKEYFLKSVQDNSSDKVKILNDENKKLKEEIKSLMEQNKDLKSKNKVQVLDDEFTQIIKKRITKENIYKIIEVLFPKTFEESSYDCTMFWWAYISYYDNRRDVIQLLRVAGNKIPDELGNIILPHEWEEDLLDKFFDTMSCHYNCNGKRYNENLRFWTYKMAANPFDRNYFHCYDEIPWQFILRNPLLNSKKYALKMAKEMNNGGNGICFSKICDYQKLDEDVLRTIVENLHVANNEEITKFIIDHINFVKNESMLDELFSVVVNKSECDRYILKMPEKYQERYAKSLDRPEKVINFLNKTSFSKDKKMEILGNIFK